MTFVTIPAGEFMMGNRAGEKNETPEHRVRISTFELQDTETTQAQWMSVMGTNPSYFKGENHPVDSVSWHDVQEFIARLNARGDQHLYRLPTEAEWEYAARAGAAPDTAAAAGTSVFTQATRRCEVTQLVRFHQTHGDCSTCEATSGNGSLIGTRSTPGGISSILEDQQTVGSESSEASDGTARRRRCARPSASPANLHSAIRLLVFDL